MSDTVEWINHRGKRILQATYTGLDEAGRLAAIDEMKGMITAEPGGSTARLLIDMTDTELTPATKEKSRELADAANEAGIKIEIAVIGVTGVRRLAARALVRDLHFARNADAAKDYLAGK